MAVPSLRFVQMLLEICINFGTGGVLFLYTASGLV